MDNLKDSLKRFLLRDLRRQQIRKEAGADNTLRGILTNLKRGEIDRKAAAEELMETLLTKLRHEIVNVEPRTAELLSYMSDQLQKSYPWVDALILVGGAAHLGGEVRSRLGHTVVVHDLDWGVITDEREVYLQSKDLTDLTKSGNQMIRELQERSDPLTKSFPKDFKSCGIYNPATTHEKNLSLDDALLYQKQYDAEFIEKLVILLHPTFPKEVGELNQEKVLSFLRQLSTRDHAKWQGLVTGMVKHWEKLHLLLGKYLLREEEIGISMTKQADKIQAMSTGKATDAFVGLLNLTDTTPKSSLLEKMEARRKFREER